MKEIVGIFLSVKLLLAGNAFSQNIEFQNIKDGLSQNTVTSIIQDQKGFLWVGTRDGLNRYDGTYFKLYDYDSNNPNTISNSSVTCLYIDDKNVLWAGTTKGLSRYQEANDTFDRILLSESSNFNERYNIRTILRQGDKLYIGTQNNSLVVYDVVNKNISRFSPLIEDDGSGIYISSVIRRNENELFLASAGYGLYIFNTQSNEFSRLSSEESSLEILENGSIRTMIKDPNEVDVLWVGMNAGGFYKISRALNGKLLASRPFDHQFQNQQLSNTTCMSLFHDGRMISIGTENLGLYQLNITTNNWTHFQHNPLDNKTISSNSIWSLYEDRNGRFWIGTYNQGLNVRDEYGSKFDHYYVKTSVPSGLKSNNISSFVETTDQNFWIGTDGGGLNYWDRRTNTISNFQALTNGRINLTSESILNLTMDPSGKLYIATWSGGVNIFDPRTRTLNVMNSTNSFLNGDNIFDVHLDKNGYLWIASFGEGLYCYDPVSDVRKIFHGNESITPGSFGNDFSTIFEDSKGRIWGGTQSQGVIQLQHDGELNFVRKRYYPDGSDGALSNSDVISIFEDQSGNIWIGTADGLNKFDEDNQTFTIVGKREGLTSSYINSIEEGARGALWLATNRGLIRFDPRDYSSVVFRPEDGLQSLEFYRDASLTTSDGSLLFGGNNGFNEVDPLNIKLNPNAPGVFLSDFKLFNRSIFDDPDQQIIVGNINLVDRIVLDYGQTIIGFEFIGLNFTHSARNQYAYYLEGFEEDFNYVGETRSATYTNLDPGIYTFIVKASNNDGIWNEDPLNITLVITPPFWMTIAFRLAVGLLVIGIVIVIYKMRISSIKKYQERLKSEIQKQTKEIEEQRNLLLASSGELETANEKIQIANEELIERNEEMMQFTSAVSHDLKSPISSIQNFLTFLEKDLEADKKENIPKYLEYMRSACDGMKNLVLDIVKLNEAGRTTQIEIINFKDVVKDSLSLVQGRLDENKIEFNSDTNFPEVSIDKNKMVRVVENLIDNSIKFMGSQNHPKIKVGYSGLKNMNHEFYVQDNGKGIPADKKQKVFIIFERLQSDVEGSGLGLAMVKKIVNNHQGRIWVESEGENRGTTFFFTLPQIDK